MKKLVRSENKVLGGVCAGVAEYFGWNAGTLRFVWVLLSIVGVGCPVIFYVLLWLLMPDAANAGKSFEERMKKRLEK